MKISKKKKLRVYLIIIGFITLAIITLIILFAFKEGIEFYKSPSQLISEDLNQNLKLRVGGLVEENSLKMKGIENEFVITDKKNVVKVIYSGVLPDLFSEGRGVIVKGKFNGKIFLAEEVLAKHDEKYMPRELKNTLKEY
mgnify:FL=1|tara:strand:+ start:197 stop:616 length:420 start_codon:yes stop_codon:yes gene_type:complete